MTVECPECEMQMRVKGARVGMTIRVSCPGCGEILRFDFVEREREQEQREVEVMWLDIPIRTRPGLEMGV